MKCWMRFLAVGGGGEQNIDPVLIFLTRVNSDKSSSRTESDPNSERRKSTWAGNEKGVSAGEEGILVDIRNAMLMEWYGMGWNLALANCTTGLTRPC